ncbi:MAG TPA: DUF177 domain-containing protein [Ruminococcaceae bacterium]|nr:DUF177 domain-containing protein [Oscillospiraceae bacterium]
MLVNLKDVFAGGAPVDIDYTLDLSQLEVPGGTFPFAEAVRVLGRIENHAGVVTLEAEAQTMLHVICDRCLSPFKRNLHIPFQNILTDQQLDKENDHILVCMGQVLDMDLLVTTNLVLALPMKELCRPDCKGICPRCGKDLNSGPCNCKPEGHPAFLKLKELLEDEQ